MKLKFWQKPTRIDNLKDEIINQQDKDFKDIAKINKRFKILVEDGEIEIVIKNIKGVIKENKK